MGDKQLSSEQPTSEEFITAADGQETEHPPAEEKQPAAQAKIHGHLVPNRHDRRRAAAKARRKGRKK